MRSSKARLVVVVGTRGQIDSPVNDVLQADEEGRRNGDSTRQCLVELGECRVDNRKCRVLLYTNNG